MSSGKFVALYRVSTSRQGKSGLGLEAQRKAVLDYLNGGRWKLVAEYTEIESGRSANRTVLSEALATCRVHNATLIVAKFDRISRNAAFLLAIRDGNVKCVAADFPEANSLVVGVLAVVAQHEAEAISARTKAALQMKKDRNEELGNPDNLTDEARRKGRKVSAKVRIATAERQAVDFAPIVSQLRTGGATSLRAIASGLNARGISTARGKSWSAPQVQRLLRRIDATER
jgi:DNA invertase Pin-like site-specific DNA recombinase